MKFIRLPKRTGRIAIGVIAFFAVLVISLVVIYRWDSTPSELAASQDERDNTIYVDGVGYNKRPGIDTVLFIGTDKYEEYEQGEYRNNQLADFNLLLIVDRNNKQYTPLHINRDTMTDIQTYSITGKKSDTVVAQLALAHTYGTGEKDSCDNCALAVSTLLYGTEVDHYAAISLDAIPLLNDAVGGVELTMLDDLTRYDSTMTKGSDVTLSGDQATIYVRSRYGLDDSTNLNRMKRQQQYIAKWIELAKNKHNSSEDFAVDTLMDINDYLTTDMSLDYMKKLADKLSTYERLDMREIPGEANKSGRYMQYSVDESALQELVLQFFYKKAQ